MAEQKRIIDTRLQLTKGGAPMGVTLQVVVKLDMEALSRLIAEADASSAAHVGTVQSGPITVETHRV